MTDKILYLPTEGTTGFWGLRDVPVHPKDHPNVKSGMDQYSEPLDTNGFWQKRLKDYEKALESCKSNKLEIVNPEYFAIQMHNDEWWTRLRSYDDRLGKKIKPGDIFDLPEGHELSPDKKQEVYDMDGHAGIRYIDVLRLVKTETTEKQMVIEMGKRNIGKILAKELAQPEPEESQEDLWIELMKRMIVDGKDYDVLSEEFTIQRKKQ